MLPTVTVSPLNFQIGHNLFTEKGECGGGILKDILLVSTYSRGYKRLFLGTCMFIDRIRVYTCAKYLYKFEF